MGVIALGKRHCRRGLVCRPRDDTLLFQQGNRAGVIAEFLEDRSRVLALLTERPAATGCPREPDDGGVSPVPAAEAGMLSGSHHVHCRRLWIAVKEREMRHRVGPHAPDTGCNAGVLPLTCAARTEDGFEKLFQRTVIGRPRFTGGKSPIGYEVLASGDGSEPGELRIVEHC
jgi:hypothetical protein